MINTLGKCFLKCQFFRSLARLLLQHTNHCVASSSSYPKKYTNEWELTKSCAGSEFRLKHHLVVINFNDSRAAPWLDGHGHGPHFMDPFVIRTSRLPMMIIMTCEWAGRSADRSRWCSNSVIIILLGVQSLGSGEQQQDAGRTWVMCEKGGRTVIML